MDYSILLPDIVFNRKWLDICSYGVEDTSLGICVFGVTRAAISVT